MVYNTNARIDDLSGSVALNIALSELFYGAPQALDTLKEIADVLGDPNNIMELLLQNFPLDSSVNRIDALDQVQTDRLDDHHIKLDNLF